MPERTLKLPLTINRIWLGAPPPQDYIDNAASWTQTNPGCIVREWHENDILDLGLENRELWDRAPELVSSRLVPRFRSDLARYEIIWRYGGIYADHDFRCLQPLAPWLDGVEVFTVQEKEGLLANGFMGASPQHPFIRALIDGCEQSVAERPGLDPWRTVGTEYLTRIAERFPELTILPAEKFLPYHHSELRRGKAELPDDAVLDHTWGSARQQVSVIIPWRPGEPERDRALQAVIAQYAKHRDWQIVVQSDVGTGPWNKAATVNAGVERSFGDILVIADADLLCDGVELAVKQLRSLRNVNWVVPYHMLWRMNREATERVVAGEEPKDVMSDKTLLDGYRSPYPGVVGGGIVVIRRSAFERVPMDERFEGWGGEDVSWGYALSATIGRPRRLRNHLYHLWHPPQERISRNKGNEENHALFERYRKASRNRAQMTRLLREAEEARRLRRHAHV